MSEIDELKKRIAELEAGRDYHRNAHDSAVEYTSQLTKRLRELEAEIARLTERLRQHEADLEDPTLSVGEAYAYRSEDHGPGKKGA